MLRRAIPVLLAAFTLAGCAGSLSGIRYADRMQKVGAPKAGQSRIVIFQEAAKGMSLDKTADEVKIDGASFGKLPPGTYVYADLPAGRHQLVVTEPLFPGDTTRDVVLETGRTHYFMSKASSRRNSLMAVGMMGGLAGYVVGSAMTTGNDNPGPVDLLLVDEASARLAIADLQLAQ
jgi:6-phosphogluconate dehydrogenase (decarboxylating)